MKRLINLENKRGQFYLIAALVIIAVFGGFVAISNKVSYVQNPHIYDVKNEIRTEASAVIDYGTYNSNTTGQINGMLINLSKYYIREISDSNFYFLLGTKSNMTLIAYQKYPENISLNGGPNFMAGTNVYQSSFVPSGNSINININGTDYSFNAKEGENFYFVVSSQINGQDYVASS